MPARWIYKDTVGEIETLARALRVGPLTAALLRQRGVESPCHARRFLSPRLEDLKHPMIYRDMAAACAVIHAAIGRNKKIVIYGDYDVDGVTAAAILYLCVRSMGGEARAVIPDRFTEGYGLNLERLKKEIRAGMDVLITVDHGVSAAAEIDFLKTKKVECVVVDHHTPRGPLPEGIRLIGPMNLKKGAQDDPLAACGLAFKLAWALREDFRGAEPYLDLAALGTVADLCPLVGDNRVLVSAGLKRLNESPRPGIGHLIARAGLHPGSRPLTSRDIAFALAPRINAAGRMGTPDNAFKLLTTPNDLEASNLAGILHEENQQRMKTEKSILAEAVGQVEATHHFAEDRVIVVSSGRWHEGVSGIVAARLTEKYHRPALVIAVREGRAKGSGRSIPGFNLFDALNACGGGVFEKFGGHAAACGFLLPEERIPELKEKLNRYVMRFVPREILVRTIAIDALIDWREINAASAQEIRRLEPFGMQNARPLFAAQNVDCSEMNAVLSWDNTDLRFPEQRMDIAFTLSPSPAEKPGNSVQCRLVDMKPALRR